MLNLPTGTVTFLFTDIEGNTRLWEQHPEAMRQACGRHDTILRHAIESNQGSVVKGTGDGVHAAFAEAPAALAAAMAAQKRLCSEDWGSLPSLKVRMGLHTAAAELRDGDYYGASVNRAARIMAVGHGGQVLLSEVTAGLVRDSLPEDCGLQDLGEHRLRYLQRAERLFQLLHAGLPSEFPSLVSLTILPNNLPVQLTSFIGRERDMAEVKELLGVEALGRYGVGDPTPKHVNTPPPNTRTPARLVTLTGSGGCGKSRLSLQVAADLLEEYPDGVWLVELAPLTDPGLVAPTVAQVLAIVPEGNQPVMQALIDYLRPKSLLLILDNCEHLLDECARLVDALLKGCPKLRVLASSREGLGIAGEFTYQVPSLGVPPADVHSSVAGTLPPSVETLHATSLQTVDERFAQYDAVRLFVERAEAAQAGFRLTDRNAASVVEVCRRLDGIPLCLELAAARVRSLPVEQMGKRMDDVFRLLTGGSRTALPRQQTLRALIDWSYNLLNDHERSLLRRLSVFAGGWRLEAAESVCEWEDGRVGKFGNPHPHDPPLDVFNALASLVDQSLVHLDGGRYRLLETVRQYARDRLLESGEEGLVRNSHLDYFLALAEEAEVACRGPEQIEWLGRLEADHDNFRAALGWCQTEPGSARKGMRLAGALCQFWRARSYYAEGRAWAEAALVRAGAQQPTPAWAKLLYGLGILANVGLDCPSGRACLEQSATICRELGDDPGLARALEGLAHHALWQQHDYAAARSLFEKARVIFNQCGDVSSVAGCLNGLGIVARLQGDYAAARPLYQESIRLYRRLGNRPALSVPLSHLGVIAMEEGDYAAARSALEERLEISREVGARPGIAAALHWLADLAFLQKDHSRAETLLYETLSLSQEMGCPDEFAMWAAGLGLVAYRQGLLALARRFYEQSLATWQCGDSGQATTQARPDKPKGVPVQNSECKYSIAQSLEGLALLEAAQRRFGHAARLLAAAGILWGDQRASHRRNVHILADEEELEQAAAAARAGLGEEAFATAWAEGQAMTLEQAIEGALCDPDRESPTDARVPRSDRNGDTLHAL